MESVLLNRLEVAVTALLAQKRKLEDECHDLRQEKSVWLRERDELLQEVEKILSRIEEAGLEDA
ncbi:MAG: hypothetical protein BA864_04785 [Desulfuromonadales bacterium C00003093]|nr:MAG: hypothetical protein BA864_04785 [Desulfuromonadales bacterium C00003093]